MNDFYGRCITCNQVKPIVFADWEVKKGPIKVCWDCAVYYGWAEGTEFYKNNFQKMLICIKCNKLFLPKKENQIKCTDCWIKFFDKKNNITKKKSIKQSELPIW